MSTRVTNSYLQRRILSDLHAVNGRLTETQAKLASNKELTRPSDDPQAIARSLALRNSLGATQQQQRNIEDAQGWQEVTELALATITDDVHKAKELLTRGATGTADAESREAIAKEIEQILAGVKESANMSYNGQYVFAGTDTGSVPYPEGSDVYAGDANVIAREIGPGVSLQINVVGSDVLGNGSTAGDDKLLDVLSDIAAHLRDPDGGDDLQSDMSRLEKNLDQVLEARALNGARSNRLELAHGRLEELELSTIEQLSEVEDADIAKTMIDFSSQQAAYQAALKAGANIVQASLMDFLR
jgi:flagellar hook-associated protein 3 FlgL